MSDSPVISTKKAIVWGGIIGLLYPIATFILGAILNRIIPSGQWLLDGLFTPLKIIRQIVAGLDPLVLRPVINTICVTGRDDGGRVTETSFGCEIILGVIETALIAMLLGMLIGWLATIVARYGKKSATS